MAFQSFPGAPYCFIGPDPLVMTSAPAVTTNAIAAANAALTYIGKIVTSDGASHTIDTTGSSSIQWRTGAVTFANAGTSVSIGLGSVDTSNGPPGRATNVAGLITLDVASVKVGAGGGITTNAWQTSVPTIGTKAIANGDFVALSFQMTARGGADTVAITSLSIAAARNRPTATSFDGTSTFTTQAITPDAIIVFSDGALGFFYGGCVASTLTAQTFQSGSSPNERGQLFQFPFPLRIHGAYGWMAQATSADADLILYSDPLGTPVSRLSLTIDQNTISGATGASSRVEEYFASTYDVAANTPFAIIAKADAAANVTAYFATLNDAAHRASLVGGTSSYGVNRSGGSGVFAQQNTGKDNYFLGVIASACDDGVGGPVGQQCM